MNDNVREAYKGGQERAREGFIESLKNEMLEALQGSGRTAEEQAAWDKGCRGEQLDGDKK